MGDALAEGPAVWVGRSDLRVRSASPSSYVIHLLCVLTSRILDIEHEMTQFAFYYVGIGAAVFILGYFQVTETSL